MYVILLISLQPQLFIPVNVSFGEGEGDQGGVEGGFLVLLVCLVFC